MIDPRGRPAAAGKENLGEALIALMVRSAHPTRLDGGQCPPYIKANLSSSWVSQRLMNYCLGNMA